MSDLVVALSHCVLALMLAWIATATAAAQQPTIREDASVGPIAPTTTSVNDIQRQQQNIRVNEKYALLLVVSIIGVFALAWGWTRLLRTQVNKKTRELSEISSQLVASFDSIREGILTFDSVGRLSSSNRRVDEMFGFSCHVGDNVADTFNRLTQSLGHSPLLRTAWTQANSNATSADTIDIQIRTEDERHFDIFTAPIRDKTEVIIGRIWRFDDVTEKSELEHCLIQSQKMEAVGRLAGGIAHDFNNHLMGITTNLSLAKRASGDDCAGYIESAQNASDRAADLVSQLLGFSRLSYLEPRNRSLNTVVRKLLVFLERSLDSSIRFETDLAEDLGRCDIDATRIEQVLINICINARDSLPREGGCIRISTRNTDNERGRMVQVIVQDNGHGMTDDVRANIFEPFFTTKDPGKGTGLGLATSYAIIEQHGGEIECHSVPSEGTRFTISLIRNDAHASDFGDDSSEVNDECAIGEGRVLLADDEDIVRAGVEALLVSYGYEVTAVSNGQEAIDTVEKSNLFDIVLLDVTMPVLSGREAFKILADRYPHLPIVICSGHVHDISEFRSPEGRNPAAVINKPCGQAKLIGVIQKLVPHRVH